MDNGYSEEDTLILIELALNVTSQPSSTPKPPTPSPTPSPSSTPAPVQLSVQQNLFGISALNFDVKAQSVFKRAVAKVLLAYAVKTSDVSITSYSDARRLLHDENQSRILTGTLQVSYIINFFCPSKWSSSSSAAAAAIRTLTTAVQTSTFNIALKAAALSANNIQMQSVTSSSTITITDTSPSGSASKPSIDKGAAIGGALGGFFGAVIVTLVGVYVYKSVYSKYPWEREKSGFSAVSRNANNTEDVQVSVNHNSVEITHTGVETQHKSGSVLV